MLPGNSGYAL